MFWTRMKMLNLTFLFILISLGNVQGMRCWHCVSEDCDERIRTNYKPAKKYCPAGQSCQKVFFEMIEETDTGSFLHQSTVRSCSKNCVYRNDFDNCTDQLRKSRGCVHKTCCSNDNLCNHSSQTYKYFISNLLSYIVNVLCLVLMHIVFI